MASRSGADNETSFREVQLDGLVVMKIAKHCKEHLPNLVAGQLLGLDVGSTLEVTNCFPFIRVEDEGENSYAAQKYQLDMVRCLGEVNVDSATIGWYQSTILGSFLDDRMVSTQYKYQSLLTNSVCLVFDPAKTTQGSFSLKAFRLTDAFMERYKEADFTQDALTRSHLTFNDILEEVPISVRNSHLVSAFLWELEESIERETPSGLDFHRLDLSFQPFLERNVDFLIEYCDELSTENNKYQAYQRQVQRQQTAIQSYIQKRRSEALTEADIEAVFKPIPQPSRLESLLLTQQVAQFTKQINEFAGQNLSKLFLFSELNAEK